MINGLDTGRPDSKLGYELSKQAPKPRLWRKERENVDLADTPAQQTKSSTLFVSNLPYNATSVDLQTLFSDIAPVRSAFVVLDKQSRKSKGVGYVTFATKEDAASAVTQVDQHGILLDKRNLRVQIADSKSHHVEDDTPDSPTKKPRQPRQPQARRVLADPMAIRTILVSGLPSTIDSNSLWKKVRKIKGAEKILQWPLKSASGTEDPTAAQVLFLTPSAAQDAVSRLHAHLFKGSLLSVVLKKRMDTLAKLSGNPSRAGRLIVRNLPWDATEHDLRRLFLPLGPVHSITIPVAKSDVEGARPRARGFAFVWMMSKKDAERAVAQVNGMTLGGEKDGDPNGKGKERVIAVDWAISKERWDVEKENIVNEEETGKSSDTGSESGSESQGDESEEDHVGVRESADNTESGDEAKELSDVDDALERPQLPPPETGNTVFIRNVPFTATEDELRNLFRSFGPLRYARITMDAATGRSRGTGFVCFWNKADADRVIQQAELLHMETGGPVPTAGSKKNPFKFSSILTPDPSSSLAQSLVMQGRTLDVTRAVTREEADRLREQSKQQYEKQDKRNLYLMREGVIFPNAPAASTLSTMELEKRVQAFNTRRALMRSNPSLYVSKTRLSVRQLPTFVTERTLKRLATHAVRAFEQDVKKGVREALSADELKEQGAEETVEDPDGEQPSKKRKLKHGERQTAVRQAKIVRIGERVDPLTGKGRSKGYGFLEMVSHADALRVLRWANNHPDVENLMREWWKEELRDILKKESGQEKKSVEQEARVKRLKDRLQELEAEKEKKTKRTLVLEFSIENIQVVRRRSERQEGSRKGSQLKPGEKSSPEKREAPPSEADARPSKRARTVMGQEVKSKETAVRNKIGGLISRKRKEKKLKRKPR